jgi:hypothetical protein
VSFSGRVLNFEFLFVDFFEFVESCNFGQIKKFVELYGLHLRVVRMPTAKPKLINKEGAPWSAVERQGRRHGILFLPVY